MHMTVQDSGASTARTQTDVFVESEGNRWFERNQKALQAYTLDHDPIARVMQLYSIRPTRLLELGAANGFRVAALSRLSGCAGTAVEPAEEAVADGVTRRFGMSAPHFIWSPWRRPSTS
jgi:protein-L-isoaspartate O-methyltransferase